jgi:hypothetical protein
MINAILAIFPKPVLAGLLIAALIVSTIQSCRVDNLKTENAAYEVAVKQCEKTNAQNKQAISTVKLINQQCLDERRADETTHANAVVAWKVEREMLESQANEKSRDIIEVFREPSCAELAILNITDVCPAMVDGLRERADRLNGIRNGNN